MTWQLYTASIVVFIITFWRIINIALFIGRIEKAKKWVSVKAVVHDSRIVKNKTSSSENIFFYAIYEFNSITYGTKNISLYKSAKSHDKSVIRNIKVNDEIDVYCDPNAPHNSVLTKPSSHTSLFSWLTTLLIVGALFLFLYYARR
jgi:hypothetical protein